MMFYLIFKRPKYDLLYGTYSYTRIYGTVDYLITVFCAIRFIYAGFFEKKSMNM